jgi:very-short-patch-repair endonuclease
LWLTAQGRRYRVDLGFEEERVAVEMDGERWHSTPQQRERDRRRDAALAAIGWVVLRLSHDRLHRDVGGCRSDVLAALAARRAWRRNG